MVYILLLRGINVGGKHKVSMSDLKKTLSDEGFKGGKTKSTRLVESGEVAKSLCYSRMRAIFSS